ncbi:MAG: hypothetical protein AAF483_18795, partial [Planctomycetota bacterium]
DATQQQIDQEYSGAVLELPIDLIEQIAPGETVTRQTEVLFSVPGHHVIAASIEQDSLEIDNSRWCAIEIKPSQDILVIDGEIEQTNAFFLENVVNPNPQLTTGLRIEKQDTSFLRDVAPQRLAEFDVIALLDVPRMDMQAIGKLEDFVREGGGIFFVAGRNTNVQYANESLYRAGEGLLPAEFKEVVEIEESLGGGELQVIATEHPVLGPLLLLDSSPFGALRIRKMIDMGKNLDPSVEIVATGPGKRPLVVDRPMGKGRVVTMLTGFSSDWSNWVQDPTFVVLTLRAMGYLGNARKPPTSQPVGAKIEMVVTGDTVLPEAEIIVPGRSDGIRVRLPREVQRDEEEDFSKLSLAIDLNGADRNLTDSILRPGVFETWMTTAQGAKIVRSYAHNVPAAEGDLETVAHSELEQKLDGIELDIQNASTLSQISGNLQEMAQSNFLMLLLVLLLLGEQALAYSASYHAPSVGARS